MRRLGVHGFDAIYFGCFERLRNATELFFEAIDFLGLLDGDFVQLINLPFQMGDVCFEFFDAFVKVAHDESA